MFQLDCPKCGQQIRASDEFAGRKAKCPGCGALLQLPAAQGGKNTPPLRRKPTRTRKPAVPVVHDFEIRRTILGKYIASYACPHCGWQLRSQERELGTHVDVCPECDQTFRVSEDASIEIAKRRCERREAKIAKTEEDDHITTPSMNELKEEPASEQELPSGETLTVEQAGPVSCPYCDTTVADHVKYMGQTMVCGNCSSQFTAPINADHNVKVKTAAASQELNSCLVYVVIWVLVATVMYWWFTGEWDFIVPFILQ